MKIGNQHKTEINNRARKLTTPSPLAPHANRTQGFQHMLHSTSGTNMYGGNGCLTNHMYQ